MLFPRSSSHLARVAAFATLLACSPLACSGQGDAPAENLAVARPPIVGGVPASISDYPSTVALTDLAGDPFCSGTLVGPRLVVTAAHCVDGRSVDNTRVVYGYEVPSHAPSSARLIPVLVQAHPFYDPGAPEDAYGLGETNDIGAVVLQDPVAGAIIAPILPPDAVDDVLTPGRVMHIVGYGVNSNATQDSGKLYRATTPHVRHAPTELLAGRPGEPDTCYGDSGGPAYIVNDNTLWLVGATSRAWAKAVQPCGESTIYTTIPAYVDWLSGLGAELDGGVSDGGFEGGGWPPQGDASGGALLDVNAACILPTAACNPLTNEGCDEAAGQACRLDEGKSRVHCEDGPHAAPPGGMCDETSRLCGPGYHCGPSIKCEKLCCTDADCPAGVPCKSLVTLLGDIGSCGVVLEDASSPDVVEEDSAPDVVEAAVDAAVQDTGAADDAAVTPDAREAAAEPTPTDYPGEPVDPGCGCRVAAPRGWSGAAGVLMGVVFLAGVRRRRGIAWRRITRNG